MSEQIKLEEKAVFALRQLYRRYGYSQFKMSKFESYDLYMQNKDFLVSDGIITFTDTDGTLMALKPDVTLSIVKNFRKDAVPVQKVYYDENVYRIAGAGHTFREITQTGLECLGQVGPYEICEVILLAARSLQTISQAFVLDLSHMQILWDLVASLNLPYEEQASVLQAIGEKNEDALAAYPLLQKLIRLSGPMGQVLGSLSGICVTDQAKAAAEELQVIYRLLKQYDLEDHVQLDFSIVNDMNYYNGMVFRGYVEGIPSSILSGGQYDKLMEKMGKTARGVGFAVYLDQLERLDPQKRSHDVDKVVLYSDGDDVLSLTAIADSLSAEGSSVLLLKALPQNLRYGQLLQYRNGRVETIENHG